MEELLKAVNELRNTIAARDEVHAKYVEELKTFSGVTTETAKRLDEIENVVNKLADSITSLKKVVERPRFDPSDLRQGTDLEKKHLDTYVKWLRGGAQMGSKLSAELYGIEDEMKAVTGISDSGGTAGGHAVPEILARQIFAKILDISEVRGAGGVRVTPVGSPDYKRLVDELGTASGWVGETDTRNETGTPALQQVTFTHGELYALPKASEWSLDDIFFNVEAWLTESVSNEFAYREGLAVISGDGSNKPTGFLNGTPVTAGDEASPARAFGTLQYIPTGAAADFIDPATSPSVVSPGDALMDLVYSIKAAYRRNAYFWMNKATLGKVRKMKDMDANYIWAPGLTPGQPSQLLGYPINEAEGMPDVGANTFPIAFGDFNQAYEMIEIAGMRLTRDDNITAKGFVLFYMRRRLGGKLVNDDALKVLKVAAS